MTDLRDMNHEELIHYARDVHVSLDTYDRALISVLVVRLENMKEELNDKSSTKD